MTHKMAHKQLAIYDTTLCNGYQGEVINLPRAAQEGISQVAAKFAYGSAA